MLTGILGYGGVGKDTAGTLMVVDEGYERRAFADKLRELALEMNPTIACNEEDGDSVVSNLQTLIGYMGWDRCKRELDDVRRFLQNVGQGHRKMFGEDFWVNQVLPLGVPREVTDRMVITDVRYRNEAQRIVDLGGQLWVVERDGCGPINDHPSEGYADWIQDFEHTIIENNGSIEDLSRAINALLYCSCLHTSALCPVHHAYTR